MSGAAATIQVLEATTADTVLCVWCRREAAGTAKWISFHKRPAVPLCEKCAKDLERIAQAMVMFGRFVLPKMVKR